MALSIVAFREVTQFLSVLGAIAPIDPSAQNPELETLNTRNLKP